MSSRAYATRPPKTQAMAIIATTDGMRSANATRRAIMAPACPRSPAAALRQDYVFVISTGATEKLGYPECVVRILVVEDDQKLARFLERVLAEESFGVDRCNSGADAVTQARGSEYDLVLLDWMLPDLDGIEVCRQLRRGGSRVP